jgi:hypothetical protein
MTPPKLVHTQLFLRSTVSLGLYLRGALRLCLLCDLLITLSQQCIALLKPFIAVALIWEGLTKAFIARSELFVQAADADNPETHSPELKHRQACINFILSQVISRNYQSTALFD